MKPESFQLTVGSSQLNKQVGRETKKFSVGSEQKSFQGAERLETLMDGDWTLIIFLGDRQTEKYQSQSLFGNTETLRAQSTSLI